MTNKMVKIKDVKPVAPLKLLVCFSDGVEKKVDIKPFIKKKSLNDSLQNPQFFKRVKIYSNGRGIYWPNGYDLCPDFLRYYASDSLKEFKKAA